MASEHDEETVDGFGGAVVEPPPWWLEDRVLQELHDERPTALAGAIQVHFTEIGRAYAADMATRLSDQVARKQAPPAAVNWHGSRGNKPPK